MCLSDLHTTINGKKFRKGYTTGSCAAAAAKAAVFMLFSGTVIQTVEIDTPSGIRLRLKVEDLSLLSETASCSIIKNGGDDPDMTTGLRIFAKVVKSDNLGISIKTAEGIGIVTLPGLKVSPGQPAINPVPMKMILKEVQEVLPKGKGVEIIFSVPGGEEVAKKTFNPKLGIVGGISILGTTGIVEPMSEDAWKDSLALELSMAKAKGKSQIVFTFGNYGEDFAVEKLGIASENIITISNFVGFMLEKAVEYNFEKIIIIGHLGKLVKVSAGIFQTHSRVADARMEIMSAYTALEGASTAVVAKVYECRTTDSAAEIIAENGLEKLYGRLVANVSKRCKEYTFNKIEFGTVLFNADNVLLSMDETARSILFEIGSNYGQ